MLRIRIHYLCLHLSSIRMWICIWNVQHYIRRFLSYCFASIYFPPNPIFSGEIKSEMMYHCIIQFVPNEIYSRNFCLLTLLLNLLVHSRRHAENPIRSKCQKNLSRNVVNWYSACIQSCSTHAFGCYNSGYKLQLQGMVFYCRGLETIYRTDTTSQNRAIWKTVILHKTLRRGGFLYQGSTVVYDI